MKYFVPLERHPHGEGRVIGRVERVLVYTMEARMGFGDTGPVIIISDNNCSIVVSLTPRPLYS
jgi:hypothetical protein